MLKSNTMFANTSFVQGVPEEKLGDYGNYYDLKLRLLTGQIIPVFYNCPREIEPENDQISAQLEVGASYEMLIIVRANYVKYTSILPPDVSFELVPKEFKVEQMVVTRNDISGGKVLDLSWQAASQKYLAIATPKIYERHYVLLETAIGNVIINYKVLEEDLGEQAKEIAVGGYLTWGPSRLDLLAIIHKSADGEQ